MNTIQLTYGLEDVTSRVPGLFAYLEYDDNDVCHMHNALDSVNGCYGKIVASIKIPSNVQLFVDGQMLVAGGKVYSYRTLIEYYYKYRESLGDTDDFINFMDKGIGRVKVTAMIDWNECDLVPEYVYYSECSRLYNEMFDIKTMCDAYRQMKSYTDEVNCEMECLLAKYERMGGDIMLNYYEAQYNTGKRYADIYYNYATKDSLTYDMDINIVSSENDLGMMSVYMNNWIPDVEYLGGELVTYNDRTWICTTPSQSHEFDTTAFKPIIGVWDMYTMSERYVVDTGNVTYPTIEGVTESRLKEFRNEYEYLNPQGDIVRPETEDVYDGGLKSFITNTDWLYYYRVGQTCNVETINDLNNNIAIMDGYRRVLTPGYEDKHLLAYGDIITDISYDSVKNKIVFTYVIGAHLKAKLASTRLDDIGNKLYFYDVYEYDDDDYHGVVYTEEFTFDKYGELYELIRSGNFNAYVNNTPFNNYMFHKFAFNTIPDKITQSVNGVEVTKTVQLAKYHVKTQDRKDITYNKIVRDDVMVGSTYQPIVTDNVNISRGNSTAWERHMALGDIKTLDDLLTYHNGGFFNVIS